MTAALPFAIVALQLMTAALAMCSLADDLGPLCENRNPTCAHVNYMRVHLPAKLAHRGYYTQRLRYLPILLLRDVKFCSSHAYILCDLPTR